MTKLFIVSKYIVLFIPVTCCINKNQKCQYFMKACITFIFILCVICTMCSKWPDADLLKSPPARNAVCLAHWPSNATLCAELHLYRCADCCEWFGTGSLSKLGSWIKWMKWYSCWVKTQYTIISDSSAIYWFLSRSWCFSINSSESV